MFLISFNLGQTQTLRAPMQLLCSYNILFGIGQNIFGRYERLLYPDQIFILYAAIFALLELVKLKCKDFVSLDLIHLLFSELKFLFKFF